MSSFQHNPGSNSGSTWFARIAKLAIAGGLALIILWLTISGLRLYEAGRSLMEQQRALEGVLASGTFVADSAELEQIVHTVRDDVNTIAAVMGPFAPIGRHLAWLPVVGPIVADSQPLLEMANAGTEMALYALHGIGPLLDSVADEDMAIGADLSAKLAVLDAAEADLIKADQAASRLFAARSALEHTDGYPTELTELLAKLDENRGLLQDGLKLAQIAPELLGLDGARTYLIIAQNEDELRPTGGFISGAGVLTVDEGQIVDLTFENANLVDDWRNKPYGLPPQPFTEFMGMDIFLFRDANFWPDFATSAGQAMELYSYGQDVALDGVLAFDQRLLQQLLSTTGPLTVPELSRVIDAQSAISQLREEWGPGPDDGNWINERKSFMGPVANAFRNLIESGLSATSLLDLLETLQMAVQERHLQLYVTDPAAAGVLNETDWSGRLPTQPEGDYLHVVDTNMGFNKVNAVLDRSIDYAVTLDPDFGHTARLSVRYTNPPSPTDIACEHGTPYLPDMQYESLTNDCYWNYLRVYVPQNSALLSASEHPVPAASLMSGIPWPGQSRVFIAENGSLTVFDNFILLGPGQSAEVDFHYELPPEILRHEDGDFIYNLTIRKQSGTDAQIARVRVILPDEAKILQASPQPYSAQGSNLEFEVNLASDSTIIVEFRD